MEETIFLDFAVPIMSVVIGAVFGFLLAAIVRANGRGK